MVFVLFGYGVLSEGSMRLRIVINGSSQYTASALLQGETSW